jgi:photosystem II stability/assembly factor-like uncharacterized protein
MKNIFLLFCFICLALTLKAQQWEHIVPAPELASTFEPFYSWRLLSAVDADTVWFADDFGRITRTMDGGSTWKNSTIEGWQDLLNGYYMGSFYAADASRAFFTGFSFNYSPSSSSNSVTFRTADAGNTWTNAFPNGEFAGIGSFLNGIHFFNPRTGLAWGDVVLDTFEFYRTTNGGDTWAKLNPPTPTRGESIFFNNFDTVGDTIWIGTSNGRIFKSNDQGQTWAVAQLPINSTIGGVALANGREGAISVSGGNVYYTTNGGAQWTLRTRRSVNSFNPNEIFSVKGAPGVFIGANQFDGWADMSLDTCKTWGISLLQPGTSSISSLKFINPRQAWAAQSDSVVLKWKNPAVLFDPVEPDYTTMKAKHATRAPTSGAKLALWSGTPATYQVEHTLVKDGVIAATTSESRALTPRMVASSFSTTPLTGKGNYTLRTRLLQNNTTIQQHEVQLIAGDSVFSKDNDLTNIAFSRNRGNFFDLTIADTLTSITAKLLVAASTSVRLWVFGYDAITQKYSNRLHYSNPISLAPNDDFSPVGLTYSLPQALALPAGRYAIGVQFSSNQGFIFMDNHKVSTQAVLSGNSLRADSLVGYAFAPSVRANFNFKQVTVSTSEPDLAIGLRVFPNPAREQLYFDLPATLPARLGNPNRVQLRLFNINGQEVHQQWLMAGLNTLIISQLPVGIYTWQLSGSNEQLLVGSLIVH